MNIIVGGNNQLACDVFDWLLENYPDHIKAVVPEDNDWPWEKNFLKHVQPQASEHNFPLYKGEINKCFENLKQYQPDLIVLCRCLCLIETSILELPRLGCTNIHYGALPRYGGCFPISWAIWNQEKEIGITLQFMAEEFDEGDILDQMFFPILEKPVRKVEIFDQEIEVKGLVAYECYQQANQVGLEIFKKNYPLLVDGTFKPRKQDLSQKLYYEKPSIDFSKDKYFDLDKQDINLLPYHIRAFTFPPLNQYPIIRQGGQEQEIKLI